MGASCSSASPDQNGRYTEYYDCLRKSGWVPGNSVRTMNAASKLCREKKGIWYPQAGGDHVCTFTLDIPTLQLITIVMNKSENVITSVKINDKVLDESQLIQFTGFYENMGVYFTQQKGGSIKYKKTGDYVDVGLANPRLVYKTKGDRKQYVKYNRQYVTVTDFKKQSSKK